MMCYSQSEFGLLYVNFLAVLDAFQLVIQVNTNIVLSLLFTECQER